MTTRELLQQALNALEEATFAKLPDGTYVGKNSALPAALRAELAKPEPEPVAWIRPSDEGYDSAFRDNSTVVECTENKWEGWFPLYRKDDV
jgi:hypothetical protein